MGYFLTSSPDNAARASSLASPKTHGPFSRVEERGRRFYSPTLGRWTSRDPIEEEGGVNLLVFGRNCPVNAIDLMGMLDLSYSAVDVREPANAHQASESGIRGDLKVEVGIDASVDRYDNYYTDAQHWPRFVGVQIYFEWQGRLDNCNCCKFASWKQYVGSTLDMESGGAKGCKAFVGDYPGQGLIFPFHGHEYSREFTTMFWHDDGNGSRSLALVIEWGWKAKRRWFRGEWTVTFTLKSRQLPCALD